MGRGGEGRITSGFLATHGCYPFTREPGWLHDQQHPFEGGKQQAGPIHKPCPPLKTNQLAKRDWVVASIGPSVTPFHRARQQAQAWDEPAPSLCTRG